MNARTYVINEPSLVLAAEKASKTLTFHPFIAFFIPRLFGVGKREMDIVMQNIDLKEGNWGLSYETSHGMHAVMAPGPMLDQMNETMLRTFLPFVDELAQPSSFGADGVEIDLFKWIRRKFSMASTEAIYGPGNPFKKQPELENCFW